MILKDIIALMMYWRRRPGQGLDGYIFLEYRNGKSSCLGTDRASHEKFQRLARWPYHWLAKNTHDNAMQWSFAFFTAAELKANEDPALSFSNHNMNLLSSENIPLNNIHCYRSSLMRLCLWGFFLLVTASVFTELTFKTEMERGEGNFQKIWRADISIHRAKEA